MNMRIDPYTGKEYDADRWYHGAGGIWHDREAERKHTETLRAAITARREKRNANRVARGKRRKSQAEFNRSESRYDEWLKLDSAETFGEFLKSHYGKAR